MTSREAKTNPLPISALQHLLFCERQCALIHIEGLWAENRLTVEGRHLHDKAHGKREGPRGGGRFETRRDEHGNPVRIVRRLELRSDRLGLHGVADVVEFHVPPSPSGTPEVGDAPGIRDASRVEAGAEGFGRRHSTMGNASSHAGEMPASLIPVPVEYKRGKPKKDDCDRVQLCAQALCLEEMLALPAGCITEGTLFYGRTHRRQQVHLDQGLRRVTESAASRLHELIQIGVTPRIQRQPKCQRCSLLNICLPEGTGPARSASRYLARSLAAAGRGHVPEGDEVAA